VRDLPPAIRESAEADALRHGPRSELVKIGMPESMKDAETAMILAALKRQGSNVTRAAEQLGVSRRTLQRKFREDPDLAAKARAIRLEARTARRSKAAPSSP
jgi:transcriptional regulator of acetoin/glycerol metabolism